MRLIRILVALSFLALGGAIGALNGQPVVLDLGVTSLPATLGVSVLLALLVGFVIGGLVLTVSVVLPLRQRLRRAAPAPRHEPVTPAGER